MICSGLARSVPGVGPQLNPSQVMAFNTGQLQQPGGEPIYPIRRWNRVPMKATGVVCYWSCELIEYKCLVAAGTMTLYDGLNASGRVVIATFDLVVGRCDMRRYGLGPMPELLTTGCYVVLSNPLARIEVGIL